MADRNNKPALLVTGGAGFIGSNFIRYVLEKHGGYRIVNLDVLTYAGNLENLGDLDGSRDYSFVRGSIGNSDRVGELIEKHEVYAIINFAAETHNDRAVMDPSIFVDTNVGGTMTLIEEARKAGVSRYIQISTDEVYGALGPDDSPFTEKTPLDPTNPYSASKASGDLLVLSFAKTFKFPGIVTRCSNNYGPYQFPEKLIPLMVTNALTDRPLPVYGDGMQVRDWTHVDDHSSAIIAVLEKGEPGEVYNIGATCERHNIDIIKFILSQLGKPESLIEHVKDRPAHDYRYAMDASKLMKSLGWEPEMPFDKGLIATIEWYKNNESWWQRVKSGEYLEYYKKHYGKPL
ncbi:MAG: dTDP-glucose 4,6-dehydratase [Planctomycetota bacterium]|jgi:dTDP-glucose 4,6-dehydratase